MYTSRVIDIFCPRFFRLLQQFKMPHPKNNNDNEINKFTISFTVDSDSLVITSDAPGRPQIENAWYT